MRYRQLGRTGMYVSELALGTMTFGGRGFWTVVGQQGQDVADRLVERSLAAGINLIDTADVYSEGESERMLGQALRNLGVARKDVVIATKAFGRMGPGPNDMGASPYPFAMIIALAASTAFMTPVSSPVNTLVVTPGDYTFGDFLKIGVPFAILVMVVCVIMVPWLLPL